MTRSMRIGVSLGVGLALVGLNAFDGSSSSARAQAQRLQTPAEAVKYGQGGTLYEPLMKFVYELDAASNLMSVRKLTTTLAGRDVVLAVLSNPPIYRPEDVLKTDKPIVLIVNNVHGNE